MRSGSLRNGLLYPLCRLLLIALNIYLPARLLAQQQNASLEELDKVFSTISRQNEYVSNLNQLNEASKLPIGLKRTIGGMEVTIAISSWVLHPEKSELGVYARVVVPQGEKGGRSVLFFGAEGVKSSYTGGLDGELKLSLLHDVSLPFNGGNTKIVLKGKGLRAGDGTAESDTYLTIGCEGFRSLSLDADVHFPRGLIRSAESSKQAVVGHFTTTISSWDDLLVSINLPSFEVVGLHGYVFSLEDVTLDLSSKRNQDNMVFPDGYAERYLLGAPHLWRGVYAKKLSVSLPKAFSGASFMAEGFLIDDQGLTGIFTADNLLDLDKGSADGWPFSLDHFSLRLIASELQDLSFKGRLGLPLRGEKTTLGYQGYLDPKGEYLLEVSNEKELSFSMFQAKAYIEEGSKLSLSLKDDRFIPEVTLNGYMTIAADESYSDMALKNMDCLRFRNLKMQTKAPYLSIGYLGYEGEARLGNYPLSIRDIALRTIDRERVCLEMQAKLNLSDKLFSGETKIGLYARYEDKVWLFDHMEVGSIDLDAVIAGRVALTGKLDWHRGDATFGDGFSGKLSLGLSLDKALTKSGGKPKLSIAAQAGFGKKEGAPYWYVDGLATFSPGVPILGAMTLNGLGGALSLGVRANSSALPAGSALSTHYTPDKTKGLGFKASTSFAIGEAFSGNAALELSFSKSGGLSSAGFYGYGAFPGRAPQGGVEDQLKKERQGFSEELSGLFKKNDWKALSSSLKSLPDAIKDMGLSGTLCMQLDLQNSIFHANSEIYLNTPASIISGVGDRGLAGWGVFHIDPKEWYLHLGTPERRLGVQLNVGSLLAVRSGAYFMAGYRMPEMPAPPRVLAELLGQDLHKLSLGRNESLLRAGKGLAFGADLSVNTGDLQFLMMYANFKAGLGFDVMLKDYSSMQCRGRSGTIGLDGWYARGQAYIYLQGELGVKIKLWMLRMRVPVIKGGVAALLQAGLPDPTFFKGYLSLNLNVLGLIKAKARFKLTIGDECDMVVPGNSPIEEPVINDLYPSDSEQGVSVFSVPEVTFNVAMDRAFSSTDEEGVEKHYRIRLREFKLITPSGEEIAGKLLWSGDKRSLRYQAKEILPGNTELKMSVRVAFEELQGGSSWQPVYTSGKEVMEERIISFKTGGAPEHIPMENIVYAYPIPEQRYFLPEEHGKGYVQLQFGQKYLFDQDFDYKLSFLAADNKLEVPFTYQEEQNRLVFSLPRLQRNTKYKLELSCSPKETATGGATSSAEETEVSENLDADFSGKIGGERAQATRSKELEQRLLSYSFSTSRYAHFREKIEQLQLQQYLVIDAGDTFTLGAEVSLAESFDEADLFGVERAGFKPLCRVYAPLEESYFQKEALPLVYQGYPYASIRLTRREEEPLGVPPHRALALSAGYLPHLQRGATSPTFRFPFAYEVYKQVYQDYRDLQSSIVNSRGVISSDIYRRFVLNGLPILKAGKYRIVISYILPDGTETSKVDFYYNNYLKLNE